MDDGVVVLCGGRSARMGHDKISLPFGSGTVLSRVVELALAVGPPVVVVGDPRQALPAEAQVVRDAVEGRGPLAGLIAGLTCLGATRVLLVAGDMPLLVPALLLKLLDLAGEADACVPVLDGIPIPTCAVYSSRLLPRARARLAGPTRSLRGLLPGAAVRWVPGDQLRDVDPDLLSFWDCDTPEQYQAALTRAGLRT